MSDRDALAEARYALLCLRLEVAPEIANDVTQKVEAAFTAAEQRGAARALQDAADELEMLVDGQHPDALNPDHWLRDRAYRIAGGDA